MSYYDFSEPMPKSERHRKMEYADEVEKHVATSKYVRLPASQEVMANSRRKPRDDKPSQFVIDHMAKLAGNAPKSNDQEISVATERVLSEDAKKARSEVLGRLGIKR